MTSVRRWGEVYIDEFKACAESQSDGKLYPLKMRRERRVRRSSSGEYYVLRDLTAAYPSPLNEPSQGLATFSAPNHAGVVALAQTEAQ